MPKSTVTTPLRASQISPGMSLRRRIASMILRTPVAIAQSQTRSTNAMGAGNEVLRVKTPAQKAEDTLDPH